MRDARRNAWARHARAGILAAATLPFVGAASAHGAFGNGKTLGSGALHLLASPLSIAAMAGLVLALAGARESRAVPCVALAAAASAVGAAMPGHFPAWAAPAGVIAAGLFTASGLRAGRVTPWLLALCAGLAAGVAAGLDVPGREAATGAGLALLVVCNLALVLADDLLARSGLQPAASIARRVLGSWVAAVGLLLGALVLMPPG